MPSPRVALVAALSVCAACRPEVRARVEQPAPKVDLPDGAVVREIGSRQVVAVADAELRDEVDRLLDHLASLAAQGMEISEKTRLPVGWSTLQLQPRGEALILREPAFTEEAEPETHDDLSATLRVLAAQRRVRGLADVETVPVSFDQHVLVARGALEAHQVFLLRVESPGPRLSGWRLAPTTGDIGTMEVDSVPAFAVLEARPGLVSAMALPPGYMAYFDDNELIMLLDDKDVVLWHKEGAEIEVDDDMAPPSGSSPTPAPGT